MEAFICSSTHSPRQ